ncbi:hypothetical protein PE067_16200 [Paracoccus sp. DMF-8]|uniref:hypothetical protein n=1 Tax=Paracoccus sp. DMF-8 TaxID=3019445 RepID=UPI0023E40C93|nr:hypothetical protein [Paracoccus sp. DMF-8]MDF3607550.1 hypothetical protein [Paracoccus sp. DMF-8]
MTQLNHLRSRDSAARDGTLMFDDGKIVVSVGGQWIEVAEAVLRSPDGSAWRLAVSNAGVVSAVAA